MTERALEFIEISKSFDGVVALDSVSFEVVPGEVHALMGENGSGKSTVIKILTGYHAPDRGGSIRLWGSRVGTPIRHPKAHGIAVVHQDLGLLDSLSVWENISVGVGYGTGPGRPIRRRSQREAARNLVERFGQSFSVDAHVDSLTRAERSVVAILRAVNTVESFDFDRRIIVLDEPTAALAGGEVERLLEFIRGIKAQGTAVVFVSHHIQEVLALSDRLTVLRSGRSLGTFRSNDLDEDRLLRMMLGVSPDAVLPDTPDGVGQAALTDVPTLSVRNISGLVLRPMSLEARPGDVVGITGLAGMGHDEVPYLLAGVQPRRAGSVLVEGAEVKPGISRALHAGMVLVPTDRSQLGVWPMGTALENLTLPVLGELTRWFGLSHAAERARSGKLMESFNIHPKKPALRLAAFSGGNQQKLLMAKWLQRNPRVILLHGPTQGVDAGGRHDVLMMIKAAVESGATAIIASDDAEELAQVCNRVLVLRRGSVVKVLVRPHISEETIREACLGAAT